jgi:uncharacterized repeat protein (TIGR01451 family)
MRIVNLLLTIILLTLSGGYASVALAAEGAIKVSSIAQLEVEAIDKHGKKTLKRTPVEKAVPGTEVIFTTVFKNTVDKPASDIVINNPVPNDTEYKAGSAFGKDCDILFSADGGNTYAYAEELMVKGKDGKRRVALPREYTHIRWYHKVPLAAGKSAEVGFRAVIK